MIQLDPRDRRPHLVQPTRRIGWLVMVVVVLGACFAGGIFYWRARSAYSEVYRQLNIAPLPFAAESEPQISDRLDQLKREPCYRDAIIGLSEALLEAGYPRESATSLLSFADHCGDSDNESLLVHAYIGFTKIDDFSAALQVVNRLVESDPANPEYRYSRGATYERLKNFLGALADYTAALQLLGTPNDIAGDQFYDVARMYAALGRYCDAIAPIETFISYNPVERRTPQTTQIIADYAKKGGCDARYARGVGHVSFLNSTGAHVLRVTVNGVEGNFVLDSGADLVTVTPEFSERAKIKNEGTGQIALKTAGGVGAADLGYANLISVGNAEAQGVAVAIIRGSDDPFGNKLDGLLGMSFLARFSVQMSPDGLDFKPISLQ